MEVMESRVESAWDISCKMMGGALGTERCAHDGVVKSWKQIYKISNLGDLLNKWPKPGYHSHRNSGSI